MTNMKDAKTRVTMIYSRTLTGGKCGDCHRYQRRDRKLHCVKLSNMYIIPSLHTNLLSATRALQNG